MVLNSEVMELPQDSRFTATPLRHRPLVQLFMFAALVVGMSGSNSASISVMNEAIAEGTNLVNEPVSARSKVRRGGADEYKNKDKDKNKDKGNTKNEIVTDNKPQPITREGQPGVSETTTTLTTVSTTTATGTTKSTTRVAPHTTPKHQQAGLTPNFKDYAAGTGACLDLKEACPVWVAQGHCSGDGTYVSFMRMNCPRACAYCGPTSSTVTSTASAVTTKTTYRTDAYECKTVAECCPSLTNAPVVCGVPYDCPENEARCWPRCLRQDGSVIPTLASGCSTTTKIVPVFVSKDVDLHSSTARDVTKQNNGSGNWALALGIIFVLSATVYMIIHRRIQTRRRGVIFFGGYEKDRVPKLPNNLNYKNLLLDHKLYLK
jgi:hypothetical protein